IVGRAKIARGMFVGALSDAGEKAATERTEWNEPDAEFAQHRDDPWLEIPLPERVFALNGRDRMNRMRPANRFLPCLGQTEEADFSLRHEFRHRTDDFFDRHIGIDAMLVEQIDVIGAKPAQR